MQITETDPPPLLIALPLLGVKVHTRPISHFEKLMRAVDQKLMNDLVWP